MLEGLIILPSQPPVQFWILQWAIHICIRAKAQTEKGVGWKATDHYCKLIIQFSPLYFGANGNKQEEYCGQERLCPLLYLCRGSNNCIIANLILFSALLL